MKEIFRYRIACICVILASLLVFCSCGDDSFADMMKPGALELSDDFVDIPSDGRYYSVTVKVTDKDCLMRNLRAFTEAEWIRLETDTVSDDGRLTFYVRPNKELRRRESIIKIQQVGDDNQGFEKSITIRQHSEAEDDRNALGEDSISRLSRVGYGYNMLIDYMNPECVTEPIIDYARAVAAEKTWGTLIAQEGRALQSLDLHCSYSIEEMSAWMAKQTSTEVNMLFCNKSVSKFNKVSEYKDDRSTYGYSSLSKVVATRYIDEGILQSIVRQRENVFTDDFYEIYTDVNNSPSDQNVENLVKKYGTHLVTYADIGGRLDYSVNFKSEETSRQTVEKYLKYKNGKLQKDEDTEEASHNIISSGDSCHFDVYGGMAADVQALAGSANTKDKYGQVDDVLLGRWLNSIRKDKPASLSMVRCMMIPVWQLFTNKEARVMIINHILSLAYSESGDELRNRLQELSLDNYYKFSAKDYARDLQFGTSPNSTLAKVIYFDGIPKIEVCNEYVPELRADRRVTVFYPIYKGQTNIRRGFFLGDGENTPSEITFNNTGGCYVRPLEGCTSDTRLDTLYYIDGAFYQESMGIKVPENIKVAVKEEWMNMSMHEGVDGFGNYPVVKVGPGYWTRTYMTDELGFVDQWNGIRESIYTVHEKSTLYSDVFYGMVSSDDNAESFIAGDDTHWYLPTTDNLDVMMQYLGRNPKALFKNQMSGFEADFCGYVVSSDLITGEIPEYLKLGYVDKLCVIASKDDNDYGRALLIKPDYTWSVADINKSYHNRYPVRAYRSKRFLHKNKN